MTYFVNFTKAPSPQEVQEQIPFIQRWVIFKSMDEGRKSTGHN